MLPTAPSSVAGAAEIVGVLLPVGVAVALAEADAEVDGEALADVEVLEVGPAVLPPPVGAKATPRKASFEAAVASVVTEPDMLAPAPAVSVTL